MSSRWSVSSRMAAAAASDATVSLLTAAPPPPPPAGAAGLSGGGGGGGGGGGIASGVSHALPPHPAAHEQRSGGGADASHPSPLGPPAPWPEHTTPEKKKAAAAVGSGGKRGSEDPPPPPLKPATPVGHAALEQPSRGAALPGAQPPQVPSWGDAHTLTDADAVASDVNAGPEASVASNVWPTGSSHRSTRAPSASVMASVGTAGAARAHQPR